MKLEGTDRVRLARAEAWRRLVDPAVIRRCVPGLERLDPTGADRYEALLEVKLPAVTGTFTGSVEFLERIEPERLRLRLDGKGGPGFVNGEAELALAEAGAGETRVEWSADVQVGGQIARLGQRMLSGVAKDMAAQFFEALEREGAGGEAGAAPSPLVAFLQLLWRTVLRAIGVRR